VKRLGELTDLKDVEERTRINIYLSNSRYLPLKLIRNKLEQREWNEQITVYVSNIIAENPFITESEELRLILEHLKKESNNAIIEAVMCIAQKNGDYDILRNMLREVGEWTGVALASILFESNMDKKTKIEVAEEILSNENNYANKEQALNWLFREIPFIDALKIAADYAVAPQYLEQALEETVEKILEKPLCPTFKATPKIEAFLQKAAREIKTDKHRKTAVDKTLDLLAHN